MLEIPAVQSGRPSPIFTNAKLPLGLGPASLDKRESVLVWVVTGAHQTLGIQGEPWRDAVQ